MNWIALSSETPGVIRDPAGVPVEWTLLRAGDTPICQEGRKCMLDHAVLDHWEKEENKLPGDVLSRLARFQYVIETLLNPVERWDQETQCRYLKTFQKKTGGYEGCMVVVTNNGKCRTYFLPSVSKVDKARSGIGHESFV